MGRSTSRIRRRRVSAISTPSSTGSAPPDRPEPEPRATKGTPAAWQARTTSRTSLGGARQHDRARERGVLEQPVGLVGAQLVVVGEHVLVAAARAAARLRELRVDEARAGDTTAAPVTGQALGCGRCARCTSGPPDFAATVLHRLAGSDHRPRWWSPAPTAPGRGRRLRAPPVARAARALGIDVNQPKNVNDEQARTRIAAADPEAVCICAYGALIRSRCSPTTRCTTCTRRCCRGGVAPRPSSARSRPVTPRPASASCGPPPSWMPGRFTTARDADR